MTEKTQMKIAQNSRNNMNKIETVNKYMSNLNNFSQLYCCKCFYNFSNGQKHFSSQTGSQQKLFMDENIRTKKFSLNKINIVPFLLQCSQGQNAQRNICSSCVNESKSKFLQCGYCQNSHQVLSLQQNKKLVKWIQLSHQLDLVFQSKSQQPSLESLIIFSMYQQLLLINTKLIQSNIQLKQAMQEKQNAKLPDLKQQILFSSLKKINIRNIGYLLLMILICFLIISNTSRINHGVNHIVNVVRPVLSPQQKIVFQPNGNLQHFNYFKQENFFTIQKKQFNYNFAPITNKNPISLGQNYIDFLIQKTQKGWLYFGIMQQSKINKSNNLHQLSGFYGYSGYSGTIYENGQKTSKNCGKIQSKDKLTLKIGKNKKGEIKIGYLINQKLCGESFVKLISEQQKNKQNFEDSLSSERVPSQILVNYHLVIEMYNKGDIITFQSK